MRSIFKWPSAIMLAALAVLSACDKSHKATSDNAGAGTAGKTSSQPQVIARVGGEVIKTDQLDAELTTVPVMAGQDPVELQKAVLRAIVFRTALRQAAFKDKIDRDPQVALLKKAAEDKYLADIYLKRQTGSAPPPTASEVDKLIVDRPLQFDDRRIYDFIQLTVPAEQYSDLLVPMFDEKETFADLEAYLNAKSIPYSKSDVRVYSSNFQKEIQDQLNRFKVGDNVVVRGPQGTVILKIKSWVPAPLPRDQAREIAQNFLYQQSMQDRALSIQKALPSTTKIEFLGPYAGMSFIEKQADPVPAPLPPSVDAPAPEKVKPGPGGGQ
jgi:EpsD family peptidyl-prolyl cis-trans isomerase